MEIKKELTNESLIDILDLIQDITRKLFSKDSTVKDKPDDEVFKLARNLAIEYHNQVDAPGVYDYLMDRGYIKPKYGTIAIFREDPNKIQDKSEFRKAKIVAFMGELTESECRKDIKSNKAYRGICEMLYCKVFPNNEVDDAFKNLRDDLYKYDEIHTVFYVAIVNGKLTVNFVNAMGLYNNIEWDDLINAQLDAMYGMHEITAIEKLDVVASKVKLEVLDNFVMEFVRHQLNKKAVILYKDGRSSDIPYGLDSADSSTRADSYEASKSREIIMSRRHGIYLKDLKELNEELIKLNKNYYVSI